MDNTVNRGYTYPQCEPPLVEDAADAPAQTRLLAEQIDADLDTVSALIASTYQLPTAIIRLTAAAAETSGGPIDFNTVEYDPNGWASLPNIVVPTNGIYLVTGFAASAAGTDVESLAVQFTADGSGFYLQGTSPPVTSFGRMTGSGVTIRSAGAVLGMRVLFSGTDPSNFDNCWFSVTRLVET